MPAAQEVLRNNVVAIPWQDIDCSKGNNSAPVWPVLRELSAVQGPPSPE